MGVRLLGILIVGATTALGGVKTHLGPITDIAIQGGSVYSVSQGGIFLGTGKDPAFVHLPDFRASSIAVTKHRLIVAGGDPGLSGMVGVIDRRDGKFQSLRVADDLVYDVAVHGKTAALACADGRVLTINIDNLTTSSIRERYRHTAAARAVAFSGDGSHLASGGLDALVMLLPLKKGARPIQMQDHTAKVDCLVFSPNGKQIASGARDGKVRIHNLEGRLVRTYLGIANESAQIVWDNNPHIFSLAWGGKPKTLIAGAAKGSLYELSLSNNTWQRKSTYWQRPIYSLRHDTEGKLLIGTHRLFRELANAEH